jgi:hypothetical protein
VAASVLAAVAILVVVAPRVAGNNFKRLCLADFSPSLNTAG